MLYRISYTGRWRVACLGRVGRLGLLALLLCTTAHAATVMRRPINEGMIAGIQGGRSVFLECRPPRGKAAEAFFTPILQDAKTWKDYQDRMAVAVPLHKLNAPTQLKVLKALFPNDFQDNQGWWHVITYTGQQGSETWWTIAEWFTGWGTRQTELQRLKQNTGAGDPLKAGAKVLIPRALLLEAYRAPLTVEKPPPAPKPAAAPKQEKASERSIKGGQAGKGREQGGKDKAAAAPANGAGVTQDGSSDFDDLEVTQPDLLLEPMVFEGSDGELTYGTDAQGPYASYRLKKKEAIYTNVVLRFTGALGHDDVLRAANEILARNGLKDAHNIDAGFPIKIPLAMLTDQYQPPGSEARMRSASVKQEINAVRESRKEARDLQGVVIVLDPGHGGRDQGTANDARGLYEDELTYDIVCRIKVLLETETKARVYVTVKDESQGYRVNDNKRFVHDSDEVLLTTPHYPNDQTSTVSANLRWYLANDIYREEKAKGTKEENMIFLSLHCDKLYEKLRGTMVYIPGAGNRKDNESPPPGSVYAQYEEARKYRAISTTKDRRKRDEIASYEFADTLLRTLDASPHIKVHDSGEPIRRYIVRSGGRRILPAVLRNTLIPAKVLVETANLGNAEDSDRLSNPQWRQWYAEAVADALKQHFKS
ncbi:MAG: N-acetylmuramoyl-L-alanine amidase [Candidatus Hydrogenedentes bacterium]|nr:N-acetylmuramoyl-L-alanine amidase [Candidatus Hydrogenedentota bacterium]